MKTLKELSVLIIRLIIGLFFIALSVNGLVYYLSNITIDIAVAIAFSFAIGLFAMPDIDEFKKVFKENYHEKETSKR